MTLDDALTICAERFLSKDEYAQLCAEGGGEVAATWDVLALGVAERYLRGEVDFASADTFMNSLWGFAIAGGQTSPLMMRVYEAFDEGEYHHRSDPNGVDPEAKYTRPQLTAILSGELLPNTSFERTREG